MPTEISTSLPQFLVKEIENATLLNSSVKRTRSLNASSSEEGILTRIVMVLSWSNK